MVAVTHASPAELRRLVIVRSTPVVRRATAARVPARTYRRRRVAAAAILLAVVVAALILVHAVVVPGGGAAPGATGLGQDPPAAVHVVQPGDTFWGIATALRPHDDPRPLVARLIAAHGSPVLVVGERIPLPAG